MPKRPRRLQPGERQCVEAGCDVILPAPTGKGRPPIRCEEHRGKRRHRRSERAPARPRLVAVPDHVDEPPAEPEEPWDAPQPWQIAREVDVAGDPLDAEPTTPERFSGVVARDLNQVFSSHPAAATLSALTMRLARILDEPSLDPRAAATVAKELRSTVAELVRAEEGADDDLFGDGSAAPVVVPSTG